ncbi:MAG: gliding motility-associated C-terminal domain-containing protein [Aureispira sp.]|nr:gliding motility-associated C-terminal domain-containing protein [Aureispira sp.]
MKNTYTLMQRFITPLILLLLCSQVLLAQTVTVERCLTPAVPEGPFNNTTGGALTPVIFSPADFPPGYVISKMEVEIVWSKTGGAVDLGEVGFSVENVSSGLTRTVATSAGIGPFVAPPGGATWLGANPVVEDTSIFVDGGAINIFPHPSPPGNINGFYTPNTQSLATTIGTDFLATNPVGTWRILAIDDFPSTGADLFVHSYCIKISACLPTSLNAVCQAAPVVSIDSFGLLNLDFADLDGGSDTSCGIKNLVIAPNGFNCGDIGSVVPVTMTITDCLNNVDNCVSNVTITDAIAPVLDCGFGFPSGTPTYTVYVDNSCEHDFNAATNIVASDNCGIGFTGVRILGGPTFNASVTFNSSNIGLVPIEFQAIDNNGNASTCATMVSVLDTVDPIANCKDTTVYINASGVFSLDPSYVDDGSVDSCSAIFTRQVNGSGSVGYDCSMLGINTVTLTVLDASGNTDDCVANVTVIDSTAPDPQCFYQVTAYVDAAGNVTVPATALDSASTDNCGIDTVRVNGASTIAFDCSHIGATQTVTVEYKDSSNNSASCNVDIIVVDTFPPTPLCQSISVYLNGTGNAVANAADVNNGSSDVCTGTSLSFLFNTGSATANYDCSALGAGQPYTLLVSDTYGNTDSCSSFINVIDTLPPTAVCATGTVYLDPAGNVIVNPADVMSATSADNCGIVDTFLNIIGNKVANFNCNAINTPQSVELIVQDGSLLYDTCTATVNVVDTVPPTAICTSPVNVNLNLTGTATIAVSDVNNSSFDNCALGVSLQINGGNSITYTCDSVGARTAVLVVTDSSGNSSSCAATVNVNDVIPPQINCQAVTVPLISGVAIITPSDVLIAPTGDACGINTQTINGASSVTYDCDSVGTRTVIVTVTDNNGLSASCTQTVTVNDVTNPTAVCAPGTINIDLDVNGVGFVVPSMVNFGSFDDCNGAAGIDTMLVNGTDTVWYNCSDVGTRTVTLTVRDASGNPSNCTATLNIRDIIPPTVLCHDTTLYFTTASPTVVTAIPGDINNGSTDNCPSTLNWSLNGAPSFNYTCSNIGNNTATLFVSDGTSTDFCPATITIVDTINPVALCQAAPMTVHLDPSGIATLAATAVNNGSTDNCGPLTFTTPSGLPNYTFNCSDIGTSPNAITLLVSDPSGNTATCPTTVNVLDTVSPTMQCKPDTVFLDGSCNVLVTTFNINNSSNDNCSGITLSINGAPFINYTDADLGSNNVTLVGTDASGNTDSCSTTIEVVDNIPPVANCQVGPIVVQLDPTGNATLAATAVDNGSTDNCSSVSFTTASGASNYTFDCADIATNPNTITLLVTDGSGNTATCQSTVTVADTVSPVANCAASINIYVSPSSVTIDSSDIDLGSTDACGIATMVLSQTTFTCADLGANALTMTITDENGNVTVCPSNANVLDTINPVATCQPNGAVIIALDPSGNAMLAATDIDNGSGDNCGIDTFLINSLDSASFGCGDIGNNIVTLTIEDASGQSSTCQTIIEVIDTLRPTVLCQPDTLILSSGLATLTVGDIDAGSFDNCGISTATLSQTNFTCPDVGIQVVTLIITDVNNNEDSCTANVTIMDTVAPSAICTSPIDLYIDPTGNITLLPAMINNNSIDDCGIASYLVDGLDSIVYNCSNVGAQIVNFKVVDGSGNADSCAATVNVSDTTKPIMNCATFSVDLDAAGQATIDSTQFGTFSDNCAIATIRIAGDSVLAVDCANIGTANYMVVVTDVNGNVDSCAANITVNDVTVPTVVCQNNATVYLDSTGSITIPIVDVDNGSFDACGVDTMYTTNPATFDCSNIGAGNSVWLVVVDSSGNVDSCQANNITVADTVGPNMVCRDTTLYLPGSGTFINVLAGVIDGGTSDPCGFNPPLLINGVSNQILTCSHIGTQVAVLQAQDIFGNIDTCHALLTLADTTSPIALCYDSIAVFLDPSGAISTFGVQLDSSSSDNCALDIGSYQINGLDSIVYNCGSVITSPQVVTMTVSDSSGNVGSCTSNVHVIDTVSPSALCRTTPLSVILHPVNGTVDVASISLNNSSFDNCGISQILINGVNTYTYDCSEVDTNIAVLTIVDVNGNEDTCHAEVIVRDITPPSPSCQFTITTQLDTSGLVVFPVATVNNGSFDNCGIASYTVGGADTINFTCADITTSPNIINITVTDSSGNSASCTSAITVEDTIPPAAACPTIPIPVYLAGANVVINASALDSASLDNCGPITYTVGGSSTIQYTCADILTTQNETLVMTDPSGNITVCPVTVDVIDTVAPAAQCKSVTVSLNAVGEVIVDPLQINDGSTDNCGLATPGLFINGLEQDTFDCSNIGANVVTLSVVDISGNVSLCQDTVFVEDNTPPVLNCGVFDAYVDGNGNVIVSPQDVSSGNDACGITTWTINGQATDTFTCADIGSTINVTISAADGSGNTNTCTGFVNVRDIIPPTAICLPSTLTVQLDSSGIGTVMATDINFFSTDNCGLVDTFINAINQTSVTYTCDSIGNRTALLIVRDAAGNASTCTATLDIQDNIAPIAVCQNITVQLDATGVSTVAAAAIDGGSNDACGINTYLINSQATTTYDCSNVSSSNTATLTLVDPSGNTSVCVATVNVVDSLAPNVVCMDTVIYLSNTGTVTLQAPSVADTATNDNCGIANYSIDGQSSITYNCSDVGNDTVTLTVTDVYGNVDSCQATVTVRDTTAPVIVCNTHNVDLTNAGQEILTPAVLSPAGGNDACGIDTIFLSKDTITCDDQGIVPILVTAVDNNGNQGFCIALVNVTLDRPTVAPDSITLCENDTLVLDVTSIPSNGNTYSYKWQGPNGFVTQDTMVTTDTIRTGLTGADEGNYVFWISPTSGAGCPAKDTVVLDVNVVEIPVIAGNDPLCEGEEIILNISNIGTYAGDSLSFQWYHENVAIGTGNDSLIFNPVAIADTGAYTIFVYQDGCTDTMTVPYQMQVISRPTPPSPTATTPCEGGTLTLDANPSDLSRTYTYVWTGPSSFAGNTQNAAISNVTQANAGVYIVTLTDNYSCTTTGSVNATINITPQQPTMEYNQPLCFGDVLELTENTTYPSGTIYTWETPAGDTTITTVNQFLVSNAAEGIYHVTVSLSGCVSEGDTIPVSYKVGPGAFDDEFIGANGVAFRDSLMGFNVISNDAANLFTISVSDNPNGGTLVNYNNGTFDYKPIPSFFGIDTFTYQICDIQCPNTCDSANVVIEVTTDFECFIPEAISPNGDGINDFMNVRCVNDYPNAEMRVFSRWGNLVYEGGLTGFDGRFNGNDLPDGTYFYFLKLNDTSNVPKDEFNGCIIINR